MARRPKRPKDTNELAKLIADIATGETKEIDPDEGKNPAAVQLGRQGGIKGGKARAAKLTPKQRQEIAVRAAQKRWESNKAGI